MPAYRAPIPPELAGCLLERPEGCRYADSQQYFNGRTFCNEGNRGNECSSYRLSLLDNPQQPAESLVRSVCAPHAGCLRMNQVIAESLEGLAQTCSFNDKLARVIVESR